MTKVLQCDREAREAINALDWPGCHATFNAMIDEIIARHREEAQAELLEAAELMINLKSHTDMTYEDAYDSMFKSGGGHAWRKLEAAIARAKGETECQ